MTGRLPEVLCRTCSVKTANDTDAREGFYTGHIKFGPNIRHGKVNESLISEYRVHWSNGGSFTVGPMVAVVPRIRKARTTEAFCECSEAYKAVLSGVKIPPGAYGLTVLPVEVKGLVMPVGSYASIQDLATIKVPTPAPPPTPKLSRPTPLITEAPTPSPTPAPTTPAPTPETTTTPALLTPEPTPALLTPEPTPAPNPEPTTPAPTPQPTPAPTTSTTTEATTTTEVRAIRITGRVELAAADPAKFAADPSVSKALGRGIATAAHVSPDRVVVSLRAEMDLVQVHADDELAEMGLVETRQRRARTGMPGRVLMSYAITLPAYQASESDNAMKALKSQTASSLGSVLAAEVGKLSNGAKYDMKTLAIETPKATPVGTPAAPSRRHKSGADVWKPSASTLPAIIAMLVYSTQ